MLKPDEFRLCLRLTCQNYVDASEGDDTDNEDAALATLRLLLAQAIGKARAAPPPAPADQGAEPPQVETILD